MMQKAKKDEKANLLLTTHTCVEKDILKVIYMNLNTLK